MNILEPRNEEINAKKIIANLRCDFKYENEKLGSVKTPCSRTSVKFHALDMLKIIIPFLAYNKLIYLPLVVSFYTQYFFLSAYSRTS